MSKKSVLLTTSTYLVCFVGAFIINEACNDLWCRVHDDDFVGILLGIFLPLIPMFLFSLITYKMHDEVFQAWWKFARWFVPVIMLVTFLVNSQSRGGGVVATMAGGFDILLIGIFYAIFVVGSLIKITQAYRSNK